MRFFPLLASVRPITIGIAPAPPQYISELVGNKPTVTLLSIKKEMPSVYELSKMRPAQITTLIGEIICRCDGVVLPGSRRPVHGVFSGLPPDIEEDDVFLERSFWRMATVYHTEKQKKPLLASCDGVNFPTLLFGGKCAPVATIPYHEGKYPFVPHAYNAYHPLIIPKESWVYNLAAKYSAPTYDSTGNIIIPDALSTHPYYQKTLPPGTLIHAYSAEKFVPAILEFTPRTLGIQDHLEHQMPKQPSALQRAEYGLPSRDPNEKEKDGKAANHLLEGILDMFVYHGTLRKQLAFPGRTEPEMDPEVLEKLHSMESMNYWLKRYYKEQNNKHSDTRTPG